MMKGLIWQEASGAEVAEFSKVTDVAILSCGCVENHGPHIPTGTDYILADGIARMIVEREPVLMLPTLAYNINQQMKCYPGTISMPPTLWIKWAEAICDEAARNGFRKIVVLPMHGGMFYVIHAFLSVVFENQRLEYRPKKDYQVFAVGWEELGPQLVEKWQKEGLLETKLIGHGGEMETSMVMYFRPDLVHLEKLEPLPEGKGPFYQAPEGKAPRMLGLIDYVNYRLDWIKQVPKGYTGYPHKATREKGEKMMKDLVNRFIKAIRNIKKYKFSP